MDKVAVIGDKDSVLAFRSVGLEVFDAVDAAAAKELIKELSRGEYAVIFITEEIAVKIADVLKKAKTKPFPAIVPIPSVSGSNGFGMNGIKKDVEKAIGMDILFK